MPLTQSQLNALGDSMLFAIAAVAILCVALSMVAVWFRRRS